MRDNVRAEANTGRKMASETGATLLAAGGLVSAFGAASCCALPVLLGSFGLASAWLGSLALLAGPHRPALLAAAVICLVAGGGCCSGCAARSRRARRVRFAVGRRLLP